LGKKELQEFRVTEWGGQLSVEGDFTAFME
jgi:hypothetical protein